MESRSNDCSEITGGKSVKTLELLKIDGLCHIIGVEKTQVAEWIEVFKVYIPKTEDEDITYYHPEAIDALKFIKRKKSEGYQNSQISEMLANRDIHFTSDSSLEDIQHAINEGNHRENMLTIMQTIGKTVSHMADQEKEIRALKQVQHQQSKKIQMLEDQAKEINDLKQEIEILKQKQVTTPRYEIQKKSFANLFKINHYDMNEILRAATGNNTVNKEDIYVSPR